MIIRNNIFDEYVNPQDALGLHANSENLFPAMFLNSDCERFSKFEEIHEFDEKFVEVDLNNGILRPKHGYRFRTFDEPSTQNSGTDVLGDQDVMGYLYDVYHTRITEADNISYDYPNKFKNPIDYSSFEHGGMNFKDYSLFTNFYQYWFKGADGSENSLNKFINYKGTTIFNQEQLLTNYTESLIERGFISTYSDYIKFIRNIKFKNSLTYNSNATIYMSYNSTFSDYISFQNFAEFNTISSCVEYIRDLHYIGSYDASVHHILYGFDKPLIFNEYQNLDLNTISMDTLYNHHKYYDDTMKVGYRKNIKYNAIAYNRFYIPNDLDKNYIKPVDMYVGTQELMRKGLLPAFFMGINDTGMKFDLRSWKAPIELFDYEVNGLYIKQNKLSFSGFTGKRYALFNRTVIPYKDNTISIGDNMVRNKDVAATILHKVCNGTSNQEWLSLDDCKSIIEANWSGGAVDLLDNSIHKEIDKRLFADIDKKFPKFLNYMKNMDIGVQSFMIEDLNNLAILMPYGKHTFIAIDSDENLDVDHVEFTINVDENLTEGNLYYVENIGWISYYAVAKIPNEDNTAYSYIVKFKIEYKPGELLDQATLDTMDNVTTAGFNARCFMVQSEYTHLFNNQTSFKQVPVISPLLFLGGAQVTEILGPVFQFNIDRMILANKIKEFMDTYEVNFEDNDITNMCKYASLFTDDNTPRDIGALIHVLFTLYGPHGKWDFILDRIGAVVKADKIFDPILTNLKNKFSLTDDAYKKFFEYYMTANQQYSPRKNPYAYLTKVDCYAANIANNFDSLTDEFTFIGPMVDDKDVYDNFPSSKGWEPLMPHVNNGAVGFQAEMRAFIYNKDLSYKLDDMKHNVTNRWYTAPHSYTRKQYDMTNAYCVGSDFDVIIKPKYSFFVDELWRDLFREIYKDKYTRFKYHILSPEYAYTQNTLTFGYRINNPMVKPNCLCYIPLFDNCEKIIVNYRNHEDIFEYGKPITPTTYPNAYIWRSFGNQSELNASKTGEMLYISFVFDPNKQYVFHGLLYKFSWSKELLNTDPEYTRYNKLAFFNTSTDTQDHTRMDLVSITGAFPYSIYATTNAYDVNYRSNVSYELNKTLEGYDNFEKFFKYVDLSKVEVIGDRLFENWYGMMPNVFLLKMTNLKVVPQSLYHSMFTKYIVLPQKVEVIPDYIWDNKYIDTYMVSKLNDPKLLKYIVEPAGSTNSIFKYDGFGSDLAHTTWSHQNIGTKGDFLMPWNENHINPDQFYYKDVENRYRFVRGYKNNFIGKQLVFYDYNHNPQNYAFNGMIEDMMKIINYKKYTTTILCNKYYKPMSGAAYNYHRSALSDNIDGMKIGKMKFTDVIKYVSWVPNYFVGWQTDDLMERWSEHWEKLVIPKILNGNYWAEPWNSFMVGINNFIRQNSGIFVGNTNLTEDQKKLIQIKYHPKWYRNLIIFKPLRYGLDSISPDLLSKGAETPKSVYLSADDINKRTKIPHTSNNTRWSEIIAYHPAWAFFNQIKGLNHDKLDYKQNFYEETLGNVLWINSGTNTEIYKHKYQYIPFENDYFGRSYKWSSGDKYNHFDIKSVLMSYIDKIVLPQRGSYHLGAGYGTNDMLWSENDGFQLKVNGATGTIGNIDPYDKNSQYYNYRDKTRKAKKQYNYRTGYKGIRIMDTRQILANNYINFYSDTKYPINAYPEIIEDWSEQVAERGDQWLGYRSDTLKHANNLLMVYDYQKFMDSPFFERTDIGLENYGAYNRDYTKSAEFTPFPSPWNMSRRDGSGLITGMLVPPVFYVLGSNDNKNNEVKTLWSRRELPAFTDNQVPNTVEFKRNFNMVKDMVYSNSRFFNYNDITVYKRATNYDDAIAFMHTEKNMRSKGNALFTTPPAVPNNPQSDTRSTFVLTKGDNEWNNLFLYCGFPSYISLENSINYSNKTYFDIYRRGAQYMSNTYNAPINIVQPEVAAIASGPYERSEFRINVPTKYTVFMDYNNNLGQYAGNSAYMKNDDILDDIRWVDMYNGINNDSDCLPVGKDNYTRDPKDYIKVLLAQKNRPNVNNLNVMPDQFALNYKMASTPTVPALTSNYAISWRDAYYMHPCKIYEVSMSRTLGFRNVFEYHINTMPLDSGNVYQIQYNSTSTYNRFKQNYKFITDNDTFNISDVYKTNNNRVISINRQGEMGNHLIATNYGRVLDKSAEWYAGINNSYNKDYIAMDYRNAQHALNMSRNIINLSSINQYPEFVKMTLRGGNKTVPYSDTISTNNMNYYYNNRTDNAKIRSNLYNMLFMQIYTGDNYPANNVPRISKFNIRTEVNTVNHDTDGVGGYSTNFDNVYSYFNPIEVHYTLLFANTAQKLGLTNGPTWWNINSASSIGTRRDQEANQYRGAFAHVTDYYTGTPANIIRWISTNGYYEGPIVYSIGSGEFMKIYQDTYNIATMRLHMNFNGMWNSSITKTNRDQYGDPIIQVTSPGFVQRIPYRELLTRTAHGWGGMAEDSLKMRYRDACYGLWMYHDNTITGNFTYGYNESTITNVHPNVWHEVSSYAPTEGVEERVAFKKPSNYQLIEDVRLLAGQRLNSRWTKYVSGAESVIYSNFNIWHLVNMNNAFHNMHTIFENDIFSSEVKLISANNIFTIGDQSSGAKNYYYIPKPYSYFPNMINLSRPISKINSIKYKTSDYLMPDLTVSRGVNAYMFYYKKDNDYLDQYTSNFENLYYNVVKNDNNTTKPYEGTMIEKLIPLNHYSYARDIYGFLNKVKADAPKVPVSVIESSPDKMYSRNTFSALTGLTFDIPATRSNPKDTLGVINIFEFESVENGRQLNECTFEFYPLIDDPYHLVKEEGLSIEVNGVEILGGWDPINVIMENNTFIVEEINRVEITVKSAKYNWIVRVIPATNQNDKHEPVVKINLPFVCISDDSFTYQSLTRMNPFIDKYDIGGFVESYKAGGNNLANIVPLILTFGRIKEMPNNMFEEVRSKRNSNIGVSFISTFAGSHTKTKWNIDMLAPIRKVAELTDNEFHKIAALMFRMADNNDEDPVITQENSWINDGIEGIDAICGDMYELIYGNTLDNAYQVLESMPEDIKNTYLEKYYNNDDSWLDWCKQKITSNAKDHIIPLLFANCGNNNGFTVSTKVFQKYHLWCKNRNLSDKKIMFIGMFAGSYIKAVPQYLNGIDINSKIQYEDISDMPIWSASEPSKGHILFDNVINSIGKHKDMLNPNIVLRPHIVFMGYLPNDFTYAFCPLLVLNNDAIDESYLGTDTIIPKDLVNNHVINHRGQYINCTISGTLDIHKMLELYKKGNDTHIMQLSFGQFDTKQAFFNMIVRIDSSLSNKQIQTYSAKIIDLVKHVKVRFIPENAFRFKWFNSNNENKYTIYADYFLFGRKALINIINTGNEYLNPNSSYRRSFTNCINLERIPDKLIPMEHIVKNFPNFLSFIEMFNGCKTYIPTTIFRNPNNISSGFITSINVTNMFKDNYFIIEIDKDTNIVENMNGIDIKVFGKMQETTTTITEADIRKWKNVSGNYNIVFKEFIAHPEAEHNRWIPFFYCRVVMYCKIPK
nr:MAG TPA: hypothetical protein [Caudoviricetes sp.]